MNPLKHLFLPGSPLVRVSAQRRSRVSTGVFVILAIGTFALIGLLIQSWIHTQAKAGDVNSTATNALPSYGTTNAFGSNRPPVTLSNVEPHPLVAASATASITFPLLAAQGVPAKNYSVVKGDTYLKIAKANGVSINALAKANPGVDPAKPKIGQILHIPVLRQKPGLLPSNATHALIKDPQ